MRHKKFNRLTIILTEDGQTSVKDDGLKREREEMEHEWCGLTIFYHDQPGYDHIGDERYLDTPIGLVRMKLTHEELRIVKDVYQTCMNDVYELTLKPSQKELNPKYFDSGERRKFAEADLEEWRQWMIIQAVDLVPDVEEAKTPKEKIISAPMRYVRTNRSKNVKASEAKSRLVIPGHTDPEPGLYRTDAPTTSHLAVILAASIAIRI